jgi:hypothetical protein
MTIQRNWWQVFFIVIMGLSLVVIITNKFITLPILWIFGAHITFGFSFSGVATEYFRFRVQNVATGQGPPALLALGSFGLSEFVWGGTLLGQDPKLFLVFFGLVAAAIACLAYFGKKREA